MEFVFGFLGLLDGLQHLHRVHLLLRGGRAVQAHLNTGEEQLNLREGRGEGERVGEVECEEEGCEEEGGRV